MVIHRYGRFVVAFQGDLSKRDVVRDSPVPHSNHICDEVRRFSAHVCSALSSALDQSVVPRSCVFLFCKFTWRRVAANTRETLDHDNSLHLLIWLLSQALSLAGVHPVSTCNIFCYMFYPINIVSPFKRLRICSFTFPSSIRIHKIY